MAVEALRFLSLWAINAPLDERRLCRQLDAMRRDGLDGAVFHPRFYPGRPPYLSSEYLRIVSRVILHARDLGMAFWLYDENGWPSGTAGGDLLRQYPADAASMLTLHEGDAADAWHAFEHDGRRWHLRLVHTREPDYLNPEACRHFLALVHDRYRDGLDPAAWAHVEAFFTDEPEFGLGVNIDRVPVHGAIMWNSRVPEGYAQRFGRDVRTDLPLIFFNSPDGAHEDSRIRFWEFMTDCLCEGFFAPYHAWCRREGKCFTGHLKGDEHPLFQVMMNGSCHQIFRHFDLPGIDPLERFPSCDYFAREVASAAHQFGNGRAMAEVMGGGGWGSRPEDLERFLLWLVNHGTTDLVIHLYQYRLHSHAIRDWPPANPNGLNWREVYPEVLRRVRAKADPAGAGADTLVIAPYRGIMAGYEPWSLPRSNIHNCATYPDTAAGRLNDALLRALDRLPARHHFADERSVEAFGRVAGGRLFVGRQGYGTVILATGCRLAPAGLRMMRDFLAAGGRVVAAETLLPAVSRTIASAAVAETVPIHWESVEPEDNALLLEPAPGADGAWRCTFEVAGTGIESWMLEFADDIRSAELDGTALDGRAGDEGGRAVLPPLGAGRHVLRFQPAGEDAGPLFAWLCGQFQVQSRSTWTSGPDGMLVTAGPWVVVPSGPAPADVERVSAGWPFARGPFALHGTFTAMHALPAGARIGLSGTAADAARVRVDDLDLGWVWGADWSAALPWAVAQGAHRLTLQLAPSTYNRFGPHHHIDGDRHVVSADQFAAKKNFADRPDAPACTHDRFWRFRPVRPPSGIVWRTASAQAG